MMEFKLWRQLKREPYSEYRDSDSITVKELKCMYGIYQKYYANTRYEIFEKDFLEKTGVFLIIEPVNKQIVGFSTVTERDFVVNGKARHAFFSGDTIIEKEYWGNRALTRAMYRYIVSFKLRYPLVPVYWILISKGFKTYLLLANNYYSYYPHYGAKNSHLKDFVESYCKEYFAEYYNGETGLLNFGEDYQPLKADVAPISNEMRQNNTKIAFFEEKNPTWVQGTELPCVGELRWSDLYRYVSRFMTKTVSASKHDSKFIPKRMLRVETMSSDSKVA
ncbi:MULTISPECIES: hypothetical protein [Acinetobacter]|uniref:hypothetical protein n=1 Tax=Acinetobacter TaxID=469 RepID=UPI000EA3F93B|nr:MULTISPECIES: hypothetical protein [Acinetobacter]RKG44391.1 hypothetical protein D7V51_07830 [Acinetobacter cumulans]RZG57866.1 hypothetical protein EXE29_12805 [Acinetobacter sp. WCHAc060006]